MKKIKALIVIISILLIGFVNFYPSLATISSAPGNCWGGCLDPSGSPFPESYGCGQANRDYNQVMSEIECEEGDGTKVYCKNTALPNFCCCNTLYCTRDCEINP